jgi:hypothetical protein
MPRRGGKRAKKDLEKARKGLRKGRQTTTFPWARVVEKRVVIFGIDTSNPGNVHAASNAVGEVGFFQLQALARKMRAFANIPVKIIAMHHSPNIPGKEIEEERGLAPTSVVARLGTEVPEADRRAIRLLAVTHAARLVVHGHLHRIEDRRVNGIRIIGAPASTQPIKHGAARYVNFWRYTVQGKGGRVVPRLIKVWVSL